jgi:SMODS-associated and fused to various effectors sensor domain
MANPAGRVFISYRRRRLRETSALVRALHDRGISTWIDVNDLRNEPTEAAIRATLDDDKTSGAILWLTPDIEDSEIIRAVEVPIAVGRRKRDNLFWLIIVLADGLDYSSAGQLFSDTLRGEDLSLWNLTKVSAPWATSRDVRQIAQSALRNRISAIGSSTDFSSVDVVVHAKGTMVVGETDPLVLDWTNYFAGGPPSARAWKAMDRASQDVATALKQNTLEDTRIRFKGTPSLPAALLLGSTYSSRDGRIPGWMQLQPDGITVEEWVMDASTDATCATDAGWNVQDPIYMETSGNALAVCISVSDDVAGAFARSRDITSSWRAMVEIRPSEGRNTRVAPLTAHEAASLVHLTIDALRQLRSSISGIESIHIFVAGPAGFGFLLGTRLATLPTIVTYEYQTAIARYVRAAAITT